MKTPSMAARWLCAALTLLLASMTWAASPYDALPLLDQKALRAPWSEACAKQPDSTPLPLDPRKLVVPGVNKPGTAVQFNAFFLDLRNPPQPYLKKLPGLPTTCGEFRAASKRGAQFIMTRQYAQPFSLASNYANLWRVWGLKERPADFDEQVIKRYGATPAPFRNPYPLPGEDPNRTNGGSGQLPLGFAQDKWANGKWNGLVGSTCSSCHDSSLGTRAERPFAFGRSNDANDAGLTVSDIVRANGILVVLELAPLPWSAGRGSSDALGIIDYLPALFDMDTMLIAPSLLELFPTHAAGMGKAPNWWHRAWKTRQFWDGALTSDNVRSEMAFAVANVLRSASNKRNQIYYEFEDINVWLMSLSPPVYQGEGGAIDTALAEQGAVIFHERDLWANGANTGIPKQPGNGSCASCHGVYSPRYAADPAFLPDPRLKGISAVITPIETIRTDDKRVGVMADERKRRAWETSWMAYNELNPDWKTWDDNLIRSELRRPARLQYDLGQGPVPKDSPTGPNTWLKPFGYVAPPLYGTWQSAPYFHNGSVPTIWDVLKPSDRPKIWQRWYTAPGIGGKNRGYDASLASYDFKKLGWKVTELPCNHGASGGSPYLPCSNGMSTIDQVFASIANAVAARNTLAYQSPPPITDQQIASRMVFNTYLYSNGNGGHDFTQSLTDDERWALLEYLKTL